MSEVLDYEGVIFLFHHAVLSVGVLSCYYVVAVLSKIRLCEQLASVDRSVASSLIIGRYTCTLHYSTYLLIVRDHFQRGRLRTAFQGYDDSGNGVPAGTQ